MLVIKPGVQGNPITGQPSISGLSVRFRDGIAEVKDESIINLMKNSEGYRSGEFVAVDEDGEDPFSDTRSALEPTHVISEMKYGHVEGRKVSETPLKIPAPIRKLIEIEAKKMALKMLEDEKKVSKKVEIEVSEEEDENVEVDA